MAKLFVTQKSPYRPIHTCTRCPWVDPGGLRGPLFKDTCPDCLQATTTLVGRRVRIKRVLMFGMIYWQVGNYVEWSGSNFRQDLSAQH